MTRNSRPLRIVGVALVPLFEGGRHVRAWMKYGTHASGIHDELITYDRRADLYVLTPGQEVGRGKRHIEINSLGFRGNGFNREKPALDKGTDQMADRFFKYLRESGVIEAAIGKATAAS